MNGELLQGLNWLCNMRLRNRAKNLPNPRVPNTLVTLTLPYSVVTFRLKALYFKDMTREKTLGGLSRR